MKEERININPNQLKGYLEQAHLLRSQVLASMTVRLFKFPQKLLHLFSADMTDTAKSVRQA